MGKRQWGVMAGALAFLLAGTSAGRAETFNVAGSNDLQDTLANKAGPDDRIILAPGTYSERVVIRLDRLTLEGTETARTILSGGVAVGDSTTDPSGVTLQRLTVSGFPLTAAGSAQLTVKNCVLRGVDGTALAVDNATNVTVKNNTFSENSSAISLAGASGSVEANVFANNANTDVVGLGDAGVVTNNYYHGSEANGAGSDSPDNDDLDPRFVASQLGDFHLELGSPAINSAGGERDADGSERDYGAYGGPDTDGKPFPVGNVEVAAVDGTADTAVVTWDANLDHRVTGYTVYYSTTEGGGPGAAGVQSVQVTKTADAAGESVTVEGLATGDADPLTAPPEGLRLVPGDGALFAFWNALDGASQYVLEWGEANGEDPLPGRATVVGRTSYAITGLSDDVPHEVQVRGVAGTVYFFGVTARNASGGESAVVAVGTNGGGEQVLSLEVVEGPASTAVTASPGAAVARFPDLPERGGCFLDVTVDRPAAWWWAVACPLALLSLTALSGRRWLFPLGMLLVAMGVVASPTGASAAAGDGESSRWAATVTVGALRPAEKDWKDNYDGRWATAVRGAFGYSPGLQWEAGLGVGFWRDSGSSTALRAVGTQVVQGDRERRISVLPLQTYLTWNARFDPQQLLVPFLSVGLDRHYYWQSLDGESGRSGHLDGYHLSGGVKWLLDPLDPRANLRARQNYGIRRTFLVLEAEWSRIDDFSGADTDLGGLGLRAGVGLEF